MKISLQQLSKLLIYQLILKGININMSLENVKNAISNEVGGLYITTFVLIIVNIWQAISNRKKSNIILIKEIEKTPLIKVDDKVKRNTKFSYKSKDVENLSQVKFIVENLGDETVENANINIHVDDATKIIDVIGKRSSDLDEIVVNTKKNEINIPFLNSTKKHISKVEVILICDGDVSNIMFDGGGKGWSVKHKKSLSKEQKVKLKIAALILIIFEIFSLLIIEKRPELEFYKNPITAVFIVTYVYVIMIDFPVRSLKASFDNLSKKFFS